MPKKRTGLKDEICILYRKGYSDKEIAAIASCCIATVAKYRPKRERVPTNIDCPTPAEMDVLKLIAQGMRAREIADVRRCGYRTIESHINNLYLKSGVNNHTLLIAWGVQHGYCQYLNTENIQKEVEDSRKEIVDEAIASIYDLLNEEYSRIKSDVESLLAARLEDSRKMAIARIEKLLAVN